MPKLAQSDYQGVAKRLRMHHAFDTSGNLSARKVHFANREEIARNVSEGWMRQHPQFDEQIQTLAFESRPIYAVYSYFTPIGFYCADGIWRIDAAAGMHSPSSAKASHYFQSALGNLQLHGDIAPEQIIEIGHEWIAARRLTPYQRQVLSSTTGRWSARTQTLNRLRALGLLDGWALTERGYEISKFC